MKQSKPLQRKAPMRAGKPLARKGPIKRARKKAVPRLEKLHHSLVREQPCLVPRCGNPSTLHHVTAAPYGARLARSERRVVNLCARHHMIQFGPHESVEALGHTGFFERYGIDLLAVADRLWREFEASAE